MSATGVPEAFQPRAGLDESGKGDYFGPLVACAAAVVDEQVQASLESLGVMDSKRLSDGRCLELSRRIAPLVPHRVVAIGPARYNELYDSLQNVNLILAWAHARALEDLLGVVSVTYVVADQFAHDPARLERALMRNGRQVRLIQRHRAESDLAVAAASVLARARFLGELRRLSERAGVTLPKGATDVLGAARAVHEKGGLAYLGQFAKVHFATTGKLIAARQGSERRAAE